MKYAVITGASSGMGLEFSRQLAERGYGIVLISNRPEENRQAAETIRTTYATDARTIDIDLTLPEAAETVYQQVVTWKLEVEILVSNAGMLLFSTLARTPLEQLDRIVALHCTTPIKLIRLFGEDMLKRRHGYILVTSSSTAWMPYPTISHYAATKAFLKSFSRSVWYEFRRYGVSVTTLFPGAVDTPLYQLDDRKRYWFRKAGMMQTPQQTVSAALRSMFRKKHRCIPGFFTKLTVGLCAAAPAWALLPVLQIPVLKRLLNKVDLRGITGAETYTVPCHGYTCHTRWHAWDNDGSKPDKPHTPSPIPVYRQPAGCCAKDTPAHTGRKRHRCLPRGTAGEKTRNG